MSLMLAMTAFMIFRGVTGVLKPPNLALVVDDSNVQVVDDNTVNVVGT